MRDTMWRHVCTAFSSADTKQLSTTSALKPVQLPWNCATFHPAALYFSHVSYVGCSYIDSCLHYFFICFFYVILNFSPIFPIGPLLFIFLQFSCKPVVATGLLFLFLTVPVGLALLSRT